MEELREGLLEILEEMHPDTDMASCKGLVQDKILDSFDIITLITRIREAFDVVVPADRIVPENFNSLDALTKLVDRLLEEE